MKGSSSAIDIESEARNLPPFASYAQAVRMLMPLARKVVFHDHQGHSLWTSDGLEEAELSMQVQLLITRFTHADPREHHLHAHSDLPEPVHVFPIRSARNELIGAMAVQFDELPASAAYRQYATVQRMLGPLLDILRHGWHRSPMITVAPTPAPTVRTTAMRIEQEQPRSTAVASITIEEQPTPVQRLPDQLPVTLPATLRRLLITATQTLDAAFGTIMLPGHSFQLDHRLSEDESDLSVNAAVTVARTQLLRWMTVRNEPLIVNSQRASTTQCANYKLLAWPIRSDKGLLQALLIVFRRRHANNFVAADLNALEQITAQLPAATLFELEQLQATRTLVLRHEPTATQILPATSTHTSPATASRAMNAPMPAVTEDVVAPGAPTMNPATADDDPQIPLIIGLPLRSLAQRLRSALTHNAFELHVQRIAPLHNYHRPERFEVLLRMPDKYGLLTPAAFMSTAEASGLQPELDLWVTHRVVQVLRKDKILGRSQHRELCVNLSAASLESSHFIERLLDHLHDSPLLPGQLVFEIAERIAIEHPQALQRLSKQLCDAGCRIALDNCRVGTEIFDLLPQWSIDCIKVDGSLTRLMSAHIPTNLLVRSLVQRATEYGIESVAEQVESQQVCNSLLGAGIDYAQGFHLEPPEPLARQFC